LADRDPAELLRENAYLKRRNAQLQSDILDLSAEVERLRRIQDRLHGRRVINAADTPAGGASPPPRAQSGPGAADAAVLGESRRPPGGPGDGDGSRNASLAEYGIVTAPIDYFHVGAYRYTAMDDAVAEAKRRR
jgi:hypothetical protein